jgi:hypothetical protein
MAHNFRYTVRHEFSYGEEQYIFDSPILLLRYYDDLEQQLALAKVLGINYEPNRGEYLIIELQPNIVEKVLTLDEVNTILDAGQ